MVWKSKPPMRMDRKAEILMRHPAVIYPINIKMSTICPLSENPERML